MNKASEKTEKYVNDAASAAPRNKVVPPAEPSPAAADIAEAHPVPPSSAAAAAAIDGEKEKLKQQWAELARQQQEFEKFREEQQLAFEAYKEEETRKHRKRLDALWHEQTTKLMQDLETVHAERLGQIDKEAATIREANSLREQAVRERNAKELEEEFAQKRARLQAELDAEGARHRKKLAVEAEQQEKAAQHLKHREDELTEKLAEAEVQNRQIAVIRHTLETHEKQLQAKAEKMAEDRVSVIQAMFDSNQKALERANEENRTLQSRINAYETLANRLGGREPEDVLHELTDKQLSLDKLREELSRRPPQELKTHYENLERRNREQEEKLRQAEELVENMRSDNERLFVTEMELKRERQEKESWKQRHDALEILNEELEAEFKRLKSQYGKSEERDERVRAVEMPYITAPPALMDETNRPNEIGWLDAIEKRCADYGFRFPRRILNAFHTSLKVAEWSPITVLAGVSGTGKSELPRLYALFGGLNFMSLSVQPNWDSQESMLGFFNTIDNVFDAQPVLRFLAQSCKERTDDYPGLKNAMNLILLDEMNLAHIELYFAEFLSKLELRRGRSRNDLPELEVKLGADIGEPYRICLQRNILFAGTMNQDETTKSLSDKVLDRSGIIHFPRPRVLHRRPALGKLTLPKMPETLLPYEVWRKDWVVYSTDFDDNEIGRYKKFIQDINGALEVVGRALGHRVWQSIEAYMANHPDVKAARDAKTGPAELERAMRVAFEDQLVQKVMPKLRGIETRGNARTKCLDGIARMLSDNGYRIVEDFQLACDTGYGQFIWNSAKYLDETDTEHVVEHEQPDTENK